MSNSRVIENWTDSYLDVVEGLYGSWDIHPEQSTAEMCEEWQRKFDADYRTEDADPFYGGSGAYLDVLEELYGDFNLHPAMSVKETCEEWQRCFSTDRDIAVQAEPVRIKPSASRDDPAELKTAS